MATFTQSVKGAISTLAKRVSTGLLASGPSNSPTSPVVPVTHPIYGGVKTIIPPATHTPRVFLRPSRLTGR